MSVVNWRDRRRARQAYAAGVSARALRNSFDPVAQFFAGLADSARRAPPNTYNVLFGALTRAGDGGGIPTTATSITLGNDLGYFQILNGYLCVTAGGDTADLGGDGANYVLMLNNGTVYNVTVVGNAWSCGTQAEWDFLVSQSAATLAGKTLLVRRLPNGASYVSGVDGSAARLRRATYSSNGVPLTIRGDDLSRACQLLNDDVSAASSLPLFDSFVLNGAIGVRLQYLDFAPSTATKVSMTGTASFPCGSITVDNCRMRGLPQDPYGNFTAGAGAGANQFPNAEHVVTANNPASNAPFQGPFAITNNFFSWCRRATNISSGAGTVTVSGNRVRYFYEDALRFNYGGADQIATAEDNVVSEPMGKGTDAGNPHCDVIQMAASTAATTDWTVKIRRNRAWKGQTRGDYQFVLCSDFKSGGTDSGRFFVAEVVGNMFVGQTTVGINIENAKSCIVLNNVMVSETTAPTSTPSIRIGAGSVDSTTSGTHIVRRNAADALQVAGTPTLDSNVTLGAGGVSVSYASAFVGNGLGTWDPLSALQLMTWFAVKPGGPLDNGATYDAGASGSGAVTFSSTIPGSDGASVTELTPTARDPIALRIMGAETITRGGNIVPNGWIAEIRFKDVSAGKLMDGSKVRIVVSRPGFDSALNPINRLVTINGTAQLRRPLPQTYATGLSLTVGDRVVSAAKVSGSTRVYEVTAGTATTANATGPVHTTGTSVIDGLTYTYVGSVTDTSAAINDQTVARPHKQFLSNAVSSDALAYVVLDDYVYATDVLISGTVFAGAYDGNSNASLSAVMTLTNNSTLAAPEVDVAWVTQPWQMLRLGESLRAEVSVCHPYGQDSRMAAAVRFTVYNNSNAATSVSKVVTSMTASTTLTQTYGHAVPVFGAVFTQAELAAAGLADGMYSIRAEVFPFAGPKWDSDVDAFGSTGAWSISTVMPANNAKRLPFELDSDNSVPVYYAVVDGAGVSGAVSLDPATARLFPFSSINAAATALNTQNGSLKACFIYIKGGTSLTGFGGSLDSSKTYGTVWLTIERDPADSTAATINADTVTAANRICGKRTRLRNLTIVSTSQSAIDNAEAATAGVVAHELWLDGCIVTGNGSQQPISRAGWLSITNSLLTSIGVLTGNTRMVWALMGGSTLSASGGGTSLCSAVNVLGNRFVSNAILGNITARYWGDNAQCVDTQLIGCNSWYNCTNNVAFAAQCTGSTDGGTTSATLPLSGGASWFQNLIEANNSNAKGGQISADSSTIALNHLYYMFNTSAGDGYNLAYNDTGTAQVYPKLAYEIGNFSADRNSKGEYFDNVAARGGRTGNLSVRYKVGARRNFVYGIGSFDLNPSPRNLAGEVFEATSVLSGVPGFTSDRSKNGTVTPGPGNGDYRPTAASSAIGLVPAAAQCLPFDLMMTARRLDGTGVPGAFERA